MNIFERQLATIYSNAVSYQPGTRKPLSNYSLFGEHIPCTITEVGTTPNSSIVLFILKRHLDSIGKIPRRGYKVAIEDTDILANPIEYIIKDEPIWSGGIKHHIECSLEQLV